MESFALTSEPDYDYSRTIMERKSVLVTNKRRRTAAEMQAAVVNPSLSRRITRLSKSLKASNPTHMYTATTVSTWAATTTGTSYSIASQITQGDDYFQRFGNHVDLLRLRISGVLSPGTTANAACNVRLTIFRAQSAVGFVASMSSSYSPIVGSNQIQLLYDKRYRVPGLFGGGNANELYSCPIINLNLKLKHRQKYTGTGAGAETGESIFVTLQSDIAAGTGAPVFSPGHWELFFKP